MNNDVFINNGNQEYLINEDEEESERKRKIKS